MYKMTLIQRSRSGIVRGGQGLSCLKWFILPYVFHQEGGRALVTLATPLTTPQILFQAIDLLQFTASNWCQPKFECLLEI